MASCRQVFRVPAGAARGVDGDACRPPVEDLVYERFLEIEQPIARLVIARRPHAVSVNRVDAVDQNALPVQRLVVEQLTYLGETRLDELTIELPGERTQQRDTLEAEQVCQWVLVDHDGTVAGRFREEPTVYALPRQWRITLVVRRAVQP